MKFSSYFVKGNPELRKDESPHGLDCLPKILSSTLRVEVL